MFLMESLKKFHKRIRIIVPVEKIPDAKKSKYPLSVCFINIT